MPTEDEAASTEDLLVLLGQFHAGIIAIEQTMDAEVGGNWVSTSRRKTSTGHPLRNAWGLLHTSWINLGHYLVTDRQVEAWTIPALVSRSDKQEYHSIEFSPGGQVEIDVVDPAVWGSHAHTLPSEAIRFVELPSEPKYTLHEARKILDICQAHVWSVTTSDTGTPLAVVCDNCSERRPIAGGALPS